MEEILATLNVIGLQEDRQTFPYVGKVKDGGFQDIAIGKTEYRVLVRGPSGRLYALEAPIELMNEIRSP